MNLDLGIALLLGLAGIVMGVVTTFVGIPNKKEPLAWTGIYVLWLTIAWAVEPDGPFPTILVASLISGVLTGLIQGSFRQTYLDHNPQWAKEIASIKGSWMASTMKQGLVAGAMFGVLVGLVNWGLATWAY